MNGYRYRAIAHRTGTSDTTSGPATLTVTTIPAPSITVHPTNKSVVEGGEITFAVTTANASSYQWQVDQGTGSFTDVANSGPYSGATTASLKITGAASGMDGFLYRVVASGAGSPAATSESATLTVTEWTPLALTLSTDKTSYSPGDEVTVTVSGKNSAGAAAAGLSYFDIIVNYDPDIFEVEPYVGDSSGFYDEADYTLGAALASTDSFVYGDDTMGLVDVAIETDGPATFDAEAILFTFKLKVKEDAPNTTGAQITFGNVELHDFGNGAIEAAKYTTVPSAPIAITAPASAEPLVLTVSTDKTAYMAGDEATVTVTGKNSAGASASGLSFFSIFLTYDNDLFTVEPYANNGVYEETGYSLGSDLANPVNKHISGGSGMVGFDIDTSNNPVSFATDTMLFTFKLKVKADAQPASNVQIAIDDADLTDSDSGELVTNVTTVPSVPITITVPPLVLTVLTDKTVYTAGDEATVTVKGSNSAGASAAGLTGFSFFFTYDEELFTAEPYVTGGNYNPGGYGLGDVLADANSAAFTGDSGMVNAEIDTSGDPVSFTTEQVLFTFKLKVKADAQPVSNAQIPIDNAQMMNADVPAAIVTNVTILPTSAITILAAPLVLPTTIGSLVKDSAFSGTVAKTSGGADPVTYEITAGSLPAGLVLDENSGAITGTPTGAGAYDFTVTATDSSATALTKTQQYTGTITGKPSATTAAATAVTHSGAKLNGSVNDNGMSTTVTFEYGLTDNYGSDAAAATGGTVAAGDGNTAVSVTLTELLPDMTYHFRVKAVNGNGTTTGSDQTFTTNAEPLILATLAPEDDATEIGLNEELVLTFGETVTAVQGKNIVIKKAADDTVVETIEASDTTKVNVNGAIVTIDPATALAFGNGYYVQIDIGAFINGNSERYAGIADNTTWSFTTIMPAVASVTVTPASGDVALGGSTQLFAAVSVAGGAAQTVTWSSSDTNNKVTVDVTGLVTVAMDAALGTYTLTATSTADDSKAGTATIEVIKASSASVVTAAPDVSDIGTSVTVTATVSAVAPASATPTGTVTFTGPGGLNQIVALVAGQASFASATLASGTILATYSGDSAFNGSDNSDDIIVNQLPAIGTEPENRSANEDGSTSFTVEADDATGYQWQVDTGSGFVNLSEQAPYSGTTAKTLTVSPATKGMNGYKYRVIVSGGIALQTTSEEALLTVNAKPAAPTNVSAVAAGGQATIAFIAPSDAGGSAIISYEVTASPGNIKATGSGSPITVTGLTNGVTYIFTVLAINSAGSGAASVVSNEVTPTEPIGVNNDNDSGDGGGIPQPLPTTPVPPAPAAAGVDVLVNGKVENAGTAATTTVNNQTVTTIAIDQQKLEAKLAAERQGARVTVPIKTSSDVVVGELNGQMVKIMEGKQAVLEIRTDRASYTLPAEQFNISALSAQFGASVDLKDIKVRVQMAAPAADTLTIVESASKEGAFAVVAPSVDFTVTVEYEGRTVEITTFNTYVERRIAIPDNVDPNRITTGVVIDPDMTTRHVPTRIELVDGIYYAVINSLTNSTYSVVWHPLEFGDVANHWANGAVNNMGSRMVVNGTGNDSFSPDLAITRAEFAAIVVRGLGLRPENKAGPFPDVKTADWYSSAVYTAYSYQLINGFEDGTFRPTDKITREQAMAILAKAMILTKLKDRTGASATEDTLKSFTDVSDASNWAVGAITDSVAAGLVTGRNDGLLAPKANITRAEVAVIVERLLKQSELI
ncbi:MAG: S-layer homology domain-containing protein [Paenibacillaceae bacterium]|nr:S-layer homology domain-containing protein [Paenibacillaceae bacterium]